MIIKEQHIINSISKAELGISKLNDEILKLEGLSSNKIRHFLNNLLEIDNINYLEIGTWKGSTFVSSLFKNKINSAYAIDNWSEFNEGADVEKIFRREVNKHLNCSNIIILEQDCFKTNLSKLSNPIDIYLYDGAHDYDSHYKAIDYFYPVFNDEFILIVDDYDPVPNWFQVQQATQDAIKDKNLNIIYENHLKSSGRNDKNSWWNGYYVAILSKNNEKNY
jgi:hypothetical protein